MFTEMPLQKGPKLRQTNTRRCPNYYIEEEFVWVLQQSKPKEHDCKAIDSMHASPIFGNITYDPTAGEVFYAICSDVLCGIHNIYFEAL